MESTKFYNLFFSYFRTFVININLVICSAKAQVTSAINATLIAMK
jgi:hypothetical protein